MPSRMQNPATASPELSGPNTADKTADEHDGEGDEQNAPD